MSDDFEDLLRAEFASRAGAPYVPDDRMADAAISGARRIRRRRRIAAGAGGLGLVVIGAAVVVWNPLTDAFERDPTVPATTADEVQRDLDVEFVAERDGDYGVVTTDDGFVPLPVETDPLSVARVEDAYLIDAPSAVTVLSLDGTEETTFEGVSEDHFLDVNREATGFSIAEFNDDFERHAYALYPTDLPAEIEPTTFELSYEVTLEDWSDGIVVASTDLNSDTGGQPGRYYFEEEYDLGLGSVGEAGYEAAVLLDHFQPGFVCVSDLEPGVGASDTEECGPIEDEAIQTHLREVSGGRDVAERVEQVSTELGELTGGITDEESLQVETEAAESGFYDKQNLFVDPLGRWEMSFDPGDGTWEMIEHSEDGSANLSLLTPPEGALQPVRSYI